MQGKRNMLVERRVVYALMVSVCLMFACGKSDSGQTTGGDRKPDRLKVVTLDELKELDTLSEVPQLLFVTMDEWKSITERMDTIPEPLPLGVPSIEAIPIAGYTPNGPDGFVLFPRCSSEDMDVACVPIIRWRDFTPVFVGCKCYRRGEEGWDDANEYELSCGITLGFGCFLPGTCGQGECKMVRLTGPRPGITCVCLIEDSQSIWVPPLRL